MLLVHYFHLLNLTFKILLSKMKNLL